MLKSVNEVISLDKLQEMHNIVCYFKTVLDSCSVDSETRMDINQSMSMAEKLLNEVKP